MHPEVQGPRCHRCPGLGSHQGHLAGTVFMAPSRPLNQGRETPDKLPRAPGRAAEPWNCDLCRAGARDLGG